MISRAVLGSFTVVHLPRSNHTVGGKCRDAVNYFCFPLPRKCRAQNAVISDYCTATAVVFDNCGGVQREYVVDFYTCTATGVVIASRGSVPWKCRDYE